ncbi:MAG: hypothetical protein ALECFALPRED_010786 [Alectoria fallacina]|uniref:non-specific serine/threonine protein kinase n=1 Tax=Alectoria fallacina TaxID=1903189 RepID=A0A8H3I6C6_9LECA|nr:MAG: hypothetical protein ALECFALPRED_010786 [Alectoria fallacina]
MSAVFNPPPFAAPVRQPVYTAASAAVAAPAIPSGTLVPGTKVQVGGHRVVIEKYLSEGGFAHVYLVRLPKPVDGDDSAVLKRVAVPDKEALASMRTEVETMKKLKGRRQIVNYIDSHASQLKGGGYEVFLLMEYCNGGGLIDFMNTRLQNRLTEPEVLKIFSDVTLGVACMHYLKPPLLHRDLKVENVLITTSGSTRRYKLCDFGSTAPPRPAATSAVEGRLIEDDVQKNTTLQYRSPEMIDVYRKQPIDEKSDIWALGVLLYKLCYYKTPFEEQGQMAILNASFKFPGYPSFSDQTKKLIAQMLGENPQQRPNIYQVIREVCLLRGTDIPIKDIYAGRTLSEARRNQHLPSPELNVASPPSVGAFKAPLVEEKQTIPDITPMRRGRPTKAGADRKPKPSPSPLRAVANDPFVALDAASTTVPEALPSDDPSVRFPPLDDFSLLHDSGSKFAFDPEAKNKPSKDISQRVTDALADDAFAQAKPTTRVHTQTTSKPPAHTPSLEVKPISIADDTSKSKALQYPKRQDSAARRPTMVSTGTMTSPSPPSPTLQNTANSNRPLFRFPSSSPTHRSSSQPRASDTSEVEAVSFQIDAMGQNRPNLLGHRSKSQILVEESSEVYQPSLEVKHRSAYLSGVDVTVQRSKSANSKARPSSVQTMSKPNLLRRLSRERSKPEESSQESINAPLLTSALTGEADDGEEAVKIDSNVDFLKAMEEEDTSKRKEKRISSGSRHIKRASMPSVSLSGTKSLLAGRFGEAFRRFETNTGTPEQRDSSRSPVRGTNLTPIAGSEATDGRSDDGNALEESEEIPPEMRRELERRRLSQEEKRVADAAAAYRQRLAEGGDNGKRRPARLNNKAASIQSKVQSLLDENGRASPSPTKTASGYGRFTDSPEEQRVRQAQPSHPPRNTSRHTPTQPSDGLSSQIRPKSKLPQDMPPTRPSPIQNLPRNSAPPTEQPFTRSTGPPKPQPKPQTLRTGDRPPSPAKPLSLIAKKALPSRLQQQQSLLGAASLDGADDDWETNFSKRYPDLSGLEMVETEIDNGSGGVGTQGSGREMRVRDV